MRADRFIVTWWPVLAVVLLALAFFYRLAFTDLILARGDTYAYFYPYWQARDAALAGGSLPLWTPNLFMGVPLLANSQLGTFYPPNWLTLSLEAPDAIRVSILLHVAWATLGAVLLARRALRLDVLPALLAGVLFGLGGHVGAHVEQINQLHGLAWIPWLFLLLDRAFQQPRRWLPLLGLAWGVQVLSGHTQTVFISGVGMGVLALVHAAQTDQRSTLRRWGYPLVIVGVAAVIAVAVALPQLVPTQELISVSNRGGGLTQQQATAFSLNPYLVGRGLLPSYDAQPFGEYVAYVGVIGLAMAMIGAWSGSRLRWPWVALLVIGLALAFGRHNPLYWVMAGLPGFNLFRVPARWLALFALGAAMLGGLGLQVIIRREVRREGLISAVVAVLALAGLSLLADRAAEEVDGRALPSALTFAAWTVALVIVLAIAWVRRSAVNLSHWILSGRAAAALLLVAALAELWIAAHTLPHHNLSDPAVFRDTRFAINQMRVYQQDEIAPARLLSISNLLFDPGDRATLEARWARMGLDARAARYAFTATKMQETLAANLPLVWNVASIDGFDGGVLPTMYYTAFSSLLLPEGSLRTVDGRLRELLALPQCRGACIPDQRWLDLTQTGYLLMDKVYDLVYEGVFYDTGLPVALDVDESTNWANIQDFEGTSLHVIYACAEMDCDLPQVSADSVMLTPDDGEVVLLDGLSLARYDAVQANDPATFTITAGDTLTVHALTWVDTRTEDFVQLAPPGWERVYSADVKIYRNLNVMPRAFVVHEAQVYPDTWDGTEEALAAMRDPAFDPRRMAVLNGDHVPQSGTATNASAVVIEYTAERVVVEVESDAPGYLVLSDAYYPGWRAEIDGEQVPLLRANVMFRAVPIEAGAQTVTFIYGSPARNGLMVGLIVFSVGLALVLAGFALRAGRYQTSPRAATGQTTSTSPSRTP